MAGTVEREFYRYIPGPFQYSGGVAARPGFALRRARFMQPVPLQEGFTRIEAFLKQQGLPLTAFCACELRSPAPFTDQGFTDFNRHYVGTLQGWGVVAGDSNPVARSNVCPELAKPDGPSFYAFSFAAPGGPDRSFVIAGSGESREGPGTYRERTVRYGETGTDAMAEKIGFVAGEMERRMGEFGMGWPDVTGAQAYTVFDMHPSFADGLVARGAAAHGIDWHYCRPPVLGLEFEMDCRAVFQEQVLPA